MQQFAFSWYVCMQILCFELILSTSANICVKHSAPVQTCRAYLTRSCCAAAAAAAADGECARGKEKASFSDLFAIMIDSS